MTRDELVSRCAGIVGAESWDDNAVANAADRLADLLTELTNENGKVAVGCAASDPARTKTQGQLVAEQMVYLDGGCYAWTDPNATYAAFRTTGDGDESALTYLRRTLARWIDAQRADAAKQERERIVNLCLDAARICDSVGTQTNDSAASSYRWIAKKIQNRA